MSGGLVCKLAFLNGKHIYLRPLQEADALGEYPGWLNDAEVCAGNSHCTFPYSVEQAKGYIQEQMSRRDRIVLAIVQHENDLHIGNIALDRIDLIARSAELTILIGNRQAWGKGYGKEAAQLVCKHGFFALNLKRIACGTFSTNMAMRALALAIGMKEEGCRRQAFFKNGVYVDIIEYGMLRSEFVGENEDH